MTTEAEGLAFGTLVWFTLTLVVGALAGAPIAPVMLVAAAPVLLYSLIGAVISVGRARELALRLFTSGLLTIVSLPAILPGGGAAQLVALTPVVVVGLTLTPRRRETQGALLIAALLVLVGLSMARGALAGEWGSPSSAGTYALTFGVVAWFVLRLLISAESDRQREERLTAIALMPAAFVASALTLHLVGGALPVVEIQAQSSYAAGSTASILDSVGLPAIRTQLPLSSGVNSMGAIAAVGLAVGLALARAARGYLLALHVAAAALCLYAIGLSDSRLALAVGLITGVILVIRPKARVSPGWALVLPIAPVVMVVVLGSLAGTGASQALSREGGGDFSTGTGRSEVWGSILDSTLSRFSTEQLFGYGANGQVTSGAEQVYRSILGETETGSTYTAHDLYIQTVLDVGYVGLIVLIVLAVYSLRRYYWSPSATAGALSLGGLVVLLVCGVTESLPAIYFPDAMALFVVLLAASLAYPTSRRGRRPSAFRAWLLGN